MQEHVSTMTYPLGTPNRMGVNHGIVQASRTHGTEFDLTRRFIIRKRPGGVAGYPRACYRSILRVRVPPSAYSYKFERTFSQVQIDSRKARKRELATFDKNRRAVVTLNHMRDKNEGT